MRKLIGIYAFKASAKAQPQGKQFRSSGDRDEAVTAMTGPFFSFFVRRNPSGKGSGTL
jgi:hypothetical protein